MSALSFKFAALPDTNDHEIRPFVDGMDFLQPKGKELIGLDPPIFFKQDALLKGGSLFVGRCSCGEIGCDNRVVTVEISDNKVLWREKNCIVAEFPLSEYIETVRRSAQDTTWESPERTAERLVETVDFANLEESGYVFEWASARIGKGKIVLSFSHHGAQCTFDVGWDGMNPEDAQKQVFRWVRERA